MGRRRRRVEPAGTLHVGCEFAGAEVRFPYRIDDRFGGALRVIYPFALDEEYIQMLPPIAVGVAAFLAQLCLTRRLVLDFPCSRQMIESMLPMIEMLYDIRCWRDQLDLMPPPEVVLPDAGHKPRPFLTDGSKRACLAWSGGKDSTLSSVLLTKNGFEVYPVHFPVNAGAEQAEMRAVAHLAQVLGMTYQTVEFEFPQYLRVAERYATLWGIFPGYNVVPFGRDLILALLATPIARRCGATYLCMGHEHGSRANYFDYRGKRIARDDVESARGSMLLGTYIQRFISTTMRFFPPVGGLSEFRILHELLTYYPEIVPHIEFCFWGTSCGRCSKCLRYYLVQRVLGKEGLLHFQVNPLERDNCLDLRLCIENWREEEGRSYTDMVLYCLALLVQKGDIRPGEHLLEEFADEIYPYIKDEIEQMGERMMMVYADPQVPADFRVD